MAIEANVQSHTEISRLQKLEDLAADTTVFVSMPFVRGITPRELGE